VKRKGVPSIRQQVQTQNKESDNEIMMKKIKQSRVLEQSDEGDKTKKKKQSHNEEGRTTKEGKARKKAREKKMKK